MVAGFFIIFLFAVVGYMAFKFIRSIVRGEHVSDQVTPLPPAGTLESLPSSAEAQASEDNNGTSG